MTHMEKVLNRICTFIIFLSTLTGIKAQKNVDKFEYCGTMRVHEKNLKNNVKGVESSEQFERWLAEKIKETMTNGSQRAVITIPYIVHIIHNGEALGTASNIPTAWVTAQMNALTRDFRKQNADISILPTAFQPLASDLELEFCPAVVDPLGNILPEPGLERIDRNSRGWSAPSYSSTYIDGTIKPATIWDPNNYFNIWVCDLGVSLLGYATFPSTTLLPGLNFPQYVGTATSDGVVITYSTFGDSNAGLLTNYTKGRVLAHEVGHWVGLRHIWGDASCGDDFCNDTPVASGNNGGCPTFPKISSSCNNGPNGDLFYNYMDYTYDDCKVMFSNDQKIRAVTIMNNSPFRLSLQTSTACTLPGINAGVTAITQPCTTGAGQSVSVTLKNRGANNIAAGTVSLSLTFSGGMTGTYTLSNQLSLATNETEIITFNNINFNSTADITMQAESFLNGDVFANDNILNKVINLGSPKISSASNSTCPNSNFTITLNKPNPIATVQWQQSSNNAPFTNIAGATLNTLTASQTTLTSYRCLVNCAGNNYISDTITMPMSPANTCYCAPTYSIGCGSNDEITKVVIGTLNNTSVCASSPYYTFYNNLAVPVLERGTTHSISVSLGSDSQQNCAVWIDSNADGIFASSEMVTANTTNVGSNGTHVGSFTIPLGAYSGLTRMRVRGGDDSALSSTQACGATNSSYGETEDYLVNLVLTPINVGITAITQPCTIGTGQSVSVTIENRGQNDILPGSVSVNLTLSGGVTGNYTLTNQQTLTTTGTEIITFNNINFNSTNNITLQSEATLLGDNLLSDNLLSRVINLSPPQISSSVSSACANTNFTISFANIASKPLSTFQWQSSTNNTTFTDIAGATSATVTTSQTTLTYYRCVETCGGNSYFSNVISVPMGAVANCYCSPSYSTGCTSSDVITKVEIATLNNSSTCGTGTPIYYTFYNNLTPIVLQRSVSHTISVTFGSDPSQYCAIWIDHDGDGIFSSAEMVTQNTTSAGANGTFVGTFTLPLGTYSGITRMRVRGGDDSSLSSTQACGTSNSSYGECEDYLVELSSSTINVGVTSMTQPCATGAGQSVSVTIENRGLNNILPGSVSLNLLLSGGVTGSYTLNNQQNLSPGATETIVFNNINFNSTADITLRVESTLAGDNITSDNVLARVINLNNQISSFVTSTCSGVSFSMNLSNAVNPNATFQWQSSTNNSTFTNIAGATATTLTTSQTVLTYYRCVITCGGNNYFSNTLTMPMSAPTACYCTPTYSSGCSSSDIITKVAIGTINNSSACGPSPSFYTFYNNIAPVTLQRGISHSISVTFASDPSQYCAIWIDYNGDGTFASTEMVAQNTTSAGSNGTYVGSFIIPTGTFSGQTRMRIRGADDSALSSTQACGTSNSSYGETEDYLVNIPAQCTSPSLNVPSSITGVSASVSYTCASCTGTYIVEYGPLNFTPGIGATPGVGGTIITTTALNTNITGLLPGYTYDVYVRQTCGSSYSSNSVKRTFSTTCPTVSLPYSEGFNNSVISSCLAIQAVATVGATAPTITALTVGSFPNATPIEGTHMLRINSASTSAGNKIRISSRTISTVGNSVVEVAFKMLENSTIQNLNDKVTLQYSINNGVSWIDVADNVRYNPSAITPTWFKRMFTLPANAGNIANLRVGLLFTSGGSGNNMYVDELEVYASDLVANENNGFCQSVVVNNVSGYNTFRFNSASNKPYAEIRPNGANLGTVTMNVKENTLGQANIPTLPNGIPYLPRYFNFNASFANPFSQNVDVRLFYHYSELNDFNIATNNSESIGTLSLWEYDNPNAPNTENCDPGDNTLQSSLVSNTLATDYVSGFYIDFSTNHFTEFGLFPESGIIRPTLNAKVFLQGVDTLSGLMDDYIKSLSNFPLKDPYRFAPLNTNFVHVNNADTATITPLVLLQSGNNSIIDWVFLELRLGVSGSTTPIYTKAALLQSDGDIVDMDGVSPIIFNQATPGYYYVTVRHRNHIGFRTQNILNLSTGTNNLLNFTNNSVSIFGTFPLVKLANNTYGMNAGDSNSDGSIDAFDTILWEGQNGLFDDYSNISDYNFDGSVDALDSIFWEINNGKYQELD